MQIVILEESSGKRVTLEVEAHHTVKAVIQTLIEGLRLPEGSAYALTREGRILGPSEELASCGIGEGDTLKLQSELPALIHEQGKTPVLPGGQPAGPKPPLTPPSGELATTSVSSKSMRTLQVGAINGFATGFISSMIYLSGNLELPLVLLLLIAIFAANMVAGFLLALSMRIDRLPGIGLFACLTTGVGFAVFLVVARILSTSAVTFYPTDILGMTVAFLLFGMVMQFLPAFGGAEIARRRRRNSNLS
jgi:uncharacterized ubiquitin-like protein YukD